MSRFRRALRIATFLVAGVLAASGLSIAVSAPAQAVASNCTAFVGTDGAGYARCTSGSGYYRVGIACKGWINFGYGFSQMGNWARVGGVYQSVARCPWGSWNWSPSGGGYYAWIEKKDTI